MNKTIKNYILLVLSLVLVFGGGLLAHLIQTGDDVSVTDIRFESDGDTLSALLYVPANASAQSPAPGVLAIHGYINSRETQSAYAIELARRGYVVLALDQRGHGYSAPPAFAKGFGGPAGLSYLRSLDIVDKEKIALSGHSMGGWAVLSAAAVFPDDYTAVVVSGSSTGTFGVPDGDQTYPHNFGLVFGKYDEFSATMWGAPRGADIVTTQKLQTVFSTDQTVEADRLYGDIANGTARKLYQPAQTHPANHITGTGVAAVLDWIQMTVPAPNHIAATEQVWQWKEFGTALSLVGGILFLFAFGGVLLSAPIFSQLVNAPEPAAGIRNAGWWGAAILFILIPVFTYFPFQGYAASLLPASALFPQNLTNGFLVWALGSSLISVVLFLLWHFALGGKHGGGNLMSYGLAWHANTAKNILLSGVLAILIVAGLYLILFINHQLFLADFRFWVIAVKLMSSFQFKMFFCYFIPFCLFFIIVGLSLHGQLRRRNSDSSTRAMLRGVILMGLGIALLLLYQYVPLLSGKTLAIPAQALLTIVALQFVVLLPVTGLISTYFFNKTGHVYLGAFINGLFLTWLIVAGQATHFSFQ